MRVLHIYNDHRIPGGSDHARESMIRVSRAAGIEVGVFSRSSQAISSGIVDKVMAGLSGVYAPGAVRAAARAMADFRPDIVHTHELFPLISPWVVRRAAAMRLPVVHTCYDFRLTCPVATHFQHGAICFQCAGGHEYRAVLNNCRSNLAESAAHAVRNAVARRFRLFTDNVSMFTAPSEFSRQWLIRDVGVDPGRIGIVAPAIDIPPAPGDPGAGGYIAYAGRFAVEKGVELLVEAARRTGLPVRLAGNAETHPAIRPGDPVCCVPTRSRDELARFYRGARMLVVPSIWHETFGIVAAEAMSHGIPVIAVRLGALPDLVIDGVTGLCFDAHDVDGLARQMTRLWQAPELCRRFGLAGRERVARMFDGEAHVRSLMAAYERCLASVTPAPASSHAAPVSGAANTAAR